ncbi:hypothetical protein JTE90_010308 [Oedothorax gibbosus]|uniref:IGFBP N-terminal domain-containing protein n=1 Tax=Oedothorax gibbosus TaxID=931172 RepID=A0AAV6V4D7_9ARAC|nr:hypothetical protein JTE90_010308 [Oedothorax gibbosus]
MKCTVFYTTDKNAHKPLKLVHFPRVPCQDCVLIDNIEIIIMLKYVVLLALCVTLAHSIVCPANFCDNLECEDLTICKESNGMKIREKGSFCQCCDICIKLLGEGEHCVPEGHLLGHIPTAECARGLYCSPTSRTCTDIFN